MVLPSVDQAGLLGSRLQSPVRIRPVPPLAGMMQTSFSTSRPFEHTNAIVFPSGDQAGELLCAKPVGRARLVPAATLRRTSAGQLSFRTSRFSVESWSNAIVLPSGDHAGELWLRSPLVSWRGVPPASRTT